MPDFDLDRALQDKPPATPACQGCGSGLRFLDWDGCQEDWRDILVSVRCWACCLEVGLLFRYEATQRQRDGHTMQADGTQQLGSQCPFCGGEIGDFELCNGAGQRVNGSVSMDATPHFTAHCERCNSEIHEHYVLTGYYELEGEDIEPDVDRRVLAPEGQVPEGD